LPILVFGFLVNPDIAIGQQPPRTVCVVFLSGTHQRAELPRHQPAASISVPTRIVLAVSLQYWWEAAAGTRQISVFAVTRAACLDLPRMLLRVSCLQNCIKNSLTRGKRGRSFRRFLGNDSAVAISVITEAGVTWGRKTGAKK
jgi:hypothetical protein